MKKTNDIQTCLKLLFSFMKIGTFTFGGGFAMIPLIERDVVRKYKWLTTEEFIDMLAVTQCSPGPVAVNAAVYIGYRITGLLGAFAATIGVALPSFAIILLLAHFLLAKGNQLILQEFFKGVQPAVIALILSAGIDMGKKSIKSRYDLSAAVIAFLLLIFSPIHPILLIIAGVISGVISRSLISKNEG